MHDLNRRQFIVTTGCIGASLLTGAWPVAAQDAPENIIDIGLLSDFAKDGLSEKWERNGFFVVRMENRLFAPSARCTHQSIGRLLPGDNGAMICPMHNSVWDKEGYIEQGPATRSLPRHAIRLDAKKHVIVHLTKVFEEKEWGNAEAFIKLK